MKSKITRKVISREYKIVLNEELFAGNEASIIEKAQTFWKEVVNTIRPTINYVIGTLDTIKSAREIRFFDTNDFVLHKLDYIFRERQDLSDGTKTVTLKFRHPDRYISQDRDMESSTEEVELKFEEDIKKPFRHLFSYSASAPLRNIKLKKLKHVVKLYPGLKPELADYPGAALIQLVNNQVMKEIVITGSRIALGNGPSVIAECALIIWYKSDECTGQPALVEFSFRYGNKKEKYSSEASKCAYDLFIRLQEEMCSWMSQTDSTKTGFIYGE